MRGRIGMLMNHSSIGSTAIIGRTSKLVSSSSCSFSSSSSGEGGGGGGGGGRGRGMDAFNSSLYKFVAGQTDDSNDPSSGRGHGHGNGKALPPHQPGSSRGRGGPIQQPGNEPKRPIFLRKDDSEADFVASESRRPIGEKDLPHSILGVLPGTGTGRGQPQRKPPSQTTPPEENRHLRVRQPLPPPPPPRPRPGAETPDKANANASPAPATPRPKLSREEATRKAVGILSKGDDERQRGAGGRRRRGPYSKDDSDEEENDDDLDAAVFLGDDADGEKFAQKLGPTLMADVTEAFEDMSYDVLPDQKFDEEIEACDVNLQIECEPEYLMGDFKTNPDIDEKPPMPLAEALDKIKPFLMVSEGLKTQEQWEEAIKITMDQVPLMQEIVDHYCGPDRVTAKQQQEELERVAKTIPPNVPNSVKHFTDRAVLSLQSNPGWRFHRKWQFMDKLVNEVSKSQK